MFAMRIPGPVLIPSSHIKSQTWLHTALILELDQMIPVLFMFIIGQYVYLNFSSPWTFTKASLPVWYMQSMHFLTLLWLIQLPHFINCLFSFFGELSIMLLYQFVYYYKYFPFRLCIHHALFEDSNNEYLFTMKFWQKNIIIIHEHVPTMK